MPDIVVRLDRIEKSFGPTRVLRGIDLDFRAGEVHAIVGENGAGKSTVGKIIGGYYTFDAGRLEIFGAAVGSWTPRRALQRGIAMIHQELQLVPALSVADNIFLGIEDNAAGVLRGTEIDRFRALDQRCGFGLDPSAAVRSLRIADRQKVEIMRAIARDARVIIMDEPTSSLTADEAARLHEVIARLAGDGRTIIYVTHFLDHALATANRVTVMRDGAVVRTSAVADETKASLVEAMLGEPADVAFPAIPAGAGSRHAAAPRGAEPHDRHRPARRVARRPPRRDRRPDRPRRQRPQRDAARHLRRRPAAERSDPDRRRAVSRAEPDGFGRARPRAHPGGPAEAGPRPHPGRPPQRFAAAPRRDQPPRRGRQNRPSAGASAT